MYYKELGFEDHFRLKPKKKKNQTKNNLKKFFHLVALIHFMKQAIYG